MRRLILVGALACGPALAQTPTLPSPEVAALAEMVEASKQTEALLRFRAVRAERQAADLQQRLAAAEEKLSAPAAPTKP